MTEEFKVARQISHGTRGLGFVVACVMVVGFWHMWASGAQSGSSASSKSTRVLLSSQIASFAEVWHAGRKGGEGRLKGVFYFRVGVRS